MDRSIVAYRLENTPKKEYENNIAKPHTAVCTSIKEICATDWCDCEASTTITQDFGAAQIFVLNGFDPAKYIGDKCYLEYRSATSATAEPVVTVVSEGC